MPPASKVSVSGFACRQCGACCRIKDGIVRVSDAEIARIAAFLGMAEQAFIDRETDSEHTVRFYRPRAEMNRLDVMAGRLPEGRTP